MSPLGTSARTSKIVIVDDHSLFADSLRIALDMEGYDARRVKFHPDKPSLARLLSDLLRLQPRLVLLDLDLGLYGRGVELLEPLAMRGILTLVVTSESSQARWGECLARGACGVVAKEVPFSEILATIHKLGNGRAVMSRAERAHLIACWKRDQAVEREILARLDKLSRREAEVLGLLMKGTQVGEIARDLFVCESTVRTQVKAVLSKLQVSSQLTAVGLAHRARWTPPQDAGTAAGRGTARASRP
jgi:DNA-binding NarL/FixJ family response regulator